MKDLLSYLREKQRMENELTGYMAIQDPALQPEDGIEANEMWMIAILDSGCKRTCHGDRWMERYMKATNQNLTDSPIRQETCSIKGINGAVSTQGLRRLEVCFELEDATGAFAVGTLDSTELSNSDAPLLLSIRDQRRLQLQLDLTGDTSTVYSKLFGGNIKVTEVNGLLGLHLLPSHLALLAGHENADIVHEKLTLPDESLSLPRPLIWPAKTPRHSAPQRSQQLHRRALWLHRRQERLPVHGAKSIWTWEKRASRPSQKVRRSS